MKLIEYIPAVLIPVFLFSGQAPGQEDSENWSSLAFINAAAHESVEMEVNGAVWHEVYRQGETISGGRFPFGTWNLTFRPAIPEGEDPDQFGELNVRRTLPPQSSATAILVGDFRKPGEEDPEGEIRAVLHIKNTKLAAGENRNRLHFVNGYPDQSVILNLPGRAPQAIAPLELVTESGLSAKTVFSVQVPGGESASLSILFLPESPSVSAAVYPRPDGSMGSKASNDVVIGERRELTPAEQAERERLIEEDLRDQE